ncbi:MAG: DUF721 domain-containing protein [Planctomycetes bacterium]|nr:DUF721 domain-containing protein [Planctomycetota bacterium]MCH8965370.1 DUF721 domain-containing protein [Planctomycetota bacterium]
MTGYDEKLRMICEAKQPRRQAVPIGQVLRDHAWHRGAAAGGLAGRLRAAVDEVVDESFRKHCRSVTLNGSTLMIGLDDPGCVAAFGRQYLFALRAHLANTLPEARVFDIRFRVST